MTALRADFTASDWIPEWERLEFLGHCLSMNRQGREVQEKDLQRLYELQSKVDGFRQDGAWQAAAATSLSPLEIDVLACVVGPEVEPRVGWMYQNLQPGLSQPYASPALIQELLALDAPWTEKLHWALSPASPLRINRLIRVEQENPYRPLLPEPWFAARLMGRKAADPAPPGTVRVDIRADWDSLVLPERRKVMLREFLLWIKHREKVVGEWGGAPVGGPVALFSGPSGTGKTMAASVIARELGWPLYRVDLGRLVSKYIGETEQNLNALFDAAHNRPMVLQFDEADSLFAKRGEVKEARDRYANMEVSHLLTRIESHQGPCILTSNLRKQMDSAFSRRFQMVVEFPRPDSRARAHLWEKLFPPRAPRDPEVDPLLLGSAVSLTGGGIRNAALHSAYLAAEEGCSIGLRHVALSVWREIAKEGREISAQEMGSLTAYLPEGTHD